jgi:sirohydrochlorin cobaltochelatase
VAHNLPWTPVHAHDHHHDHDHPHTHGHHHHGPHAHHHHDSPHALLVRTAPPLAAFDANAASHSHDVAPAHHHHPYPYANHPLGPVTLPKVQGKLARKERRE